VALVPITTSSGARPAYVSSAPDPLAGREELRPVWTELAAALAPTIRLFGILGEGGMGIVFIGLDETLKRDVAIKVLSPAVADDSVARQRFRREAEAAAAVSHPNIVSVFQVGELAESRIPYIVMQFVEGPTLADAIGRILPEARVRRLMAEIASALAAAHRRRVVHRDVKPANIALDGETGRALVLDFGISAALSTRRKSKGMRLTTEGMYLGTPTYMSPEQASGDEVTVKSDVYSLGILMYELLTGEPPFTGNSLQIMAAHVRDAPPSLLERRQDLSSELAALVDRCLMKDPARRPTAQEVVNYLQPTGHAKIEWPPPGTPMLRRAGVRLLNVMMMLAMTTLVFFVVLGFQPSSTRPGVVAAPGGEIIGGNPLTRSVAVLRQHAGEVAAVWSFLLGACVVVFCILTVLLVFHAWRTIGLAWWARVSGYPWRVVLAVATDVRGDTSDLRNSSGAYAMLDEIERERIRRLRIGQTVCVILSLPVAVIGTLLWIMGVLRVSSSSGFVLPTTEGFIIAAPIAACFAAALVMLDVEVRTLTRASGSVRRRHRRTPIKADLVQSWLTANNEPVRAPRRLIPRPLLAVVLIGLGAATAVAAAAILTTVGETTARLVPARAAAAEWVQMLQTDSLRPARWAQIEPLIATSSLAPANSAAAIPAETVAREFVTSFVSSEAAAHIAWVIGSIGSVVGGVEPPVGNLSLSALARQLADARAPFTLIADTASPRLVAFRRLAHAPVLPALWAYRPGLPAVESSLALPALSAATIRSVGYANGVAGLLALRRGDTSTALLRARENASVARQLLRQFVEADAANAAVLLNQSADVIHAVAESRRLPTLAAEGDRLARAADEVRRPMRQRYRIKALALFADPADFSGIRFIGNVSLGPVARVSLVSSMVVGHCLNAREMLFGIDGRRSALLDSAETALANVPQAGSLVEADRRWMRRWLADQRGVAAANIAGLTPASPPSLLLRSLGWIGLGSVRDRMLYCREKLL
jgi:hypothetical protein